MGVGKRLTLKEGQSWDPNKEARGARGVMYGVEVGVGLLETLTVGSTVRPRRTGRGSEGPCVQGIHYPSYFADKVYTIHPCGHTFSFIIKGGKWAHVRVRPLYFFFLFSFYFILYRKLTKY